MGRASSTKKVSRAASTGGGRTARGAKPWVWYLVMGIVVVLGTAGVVFSREQRRDVLASDPSNEAPKANVDHWHAAYGIYLCNEFVPDIQDQTDPKGIHTHADGIIHIHPFVRSAAGSNATLGVFADAVDMTLSDTEIKAPGGKSFREGRTKCDGKDGIVQVKVNDQVVTDDVADVRLHDNDKVTIAFAPEGAELPPPPSVPNLSNLTDVEQPASTTTVAPAPGDTTPTVPATPTSAGGEAPVSTDTTGITGTTGTTDTTTAGTSPETTIPGTTTTR